MKRTSQRLIRALVSCLAVWLAAALWAADTPQPSWFKGNLHTHSLWSDGDDFPEMVADWYRRHGYHFLSLTEHNVLLRGDRWLPLTSRDRTIAETVLKRCRQRFGDGWVEVHGEPPRREVRLKTLDEVRERLEEPGKFLLVEGEEITGRWAEYRVHVGAINLAETIRPQQGTSVLDALRRDFHEVSQQSRRIGRPMLAIVNHPNWPWYDISATELADSGYRLFEVCNAAPDANNDAQGDLPSTERLWDIANTLRAKRNQPLLFGIAADDAHDYHASGPSQSNPGRGWVMVRAKELSIEAILRSLSDGEFYASTGVVLREIAFDRTTKTLRVEAVPEPGAEYAIEFIGTRNDCDLSSKTTIVAATKRPVRQVERFSAEIGRVLAEVRGVKAEYRFRGDEFYVRAAVRGVVKNADGRPRRVEAWCQPVARQ